MRCVTEILWTAFHDRKLINNTIQVLSDAEKRRQYDLYGPEQANNVRTHQRGRRSGFYEYDPTHGFEAGESKIL